MPTKYVRIVRSSGTTGPPLSGEVAEAFERIRERAYAIYDNRGPDAGSEYEDWLQAERELFEIPDVEIRDDEDACRVLLNTEPGPDRQLSIAVEPTVVTVIGQSTDGLTNLLRRVNLADAVDPERVRISRRDGAVEIVLVKAGQLEAPPPPPPKAMTAAVGAPAETLVFAA